MNKKSKITLAVSLIVILIFGIAMISCESSSEDDGVGLNRIQLASSNLSIEIPYDYLKGGISTKDTDLNQADSYYNPRTQVDFDVYYRAKATDETLTDAIAADANRFYAEYDETVINGVNAGSYKMRGVFGDNEYYVAAYMMEDGDYLVELVFWLLDSEDYPAVEKIMSTLKQHTSTYVDDPARIRLGTSSFSVLNTKNYEKGNITLEDTSISQVGYFMSDETLVDFDVYQWAKADNETLMGAAEEEIAEYDDVEAVSEQINGIDVVYYYAVEEYEDEEYETVTYIFEDGEFFVEIVFWLDGDTAEEEVDAIIQTLAVVK